MGVDGDLIAIYPKPYSMYLRVNVYILLHLKIKPQMVSERLNIFQERILPLHAWGATDLKIVLVAIYGPYITGQSRPRKG